MAVSPTLPTPLSNAIDRSKRADGIGLSAQPVANTLPALSVKGVNSPKVPMPFQRPDLLQTASPFTIHSSRPSADRFVSRPSVKTTGLPLSMEDGPGGASDTAAGSSSHSASSAEKSAYGKLFVDLSHAYEDLLLEGRRQMVHLRRTLDLWLQKFKFAMGVLVCAFPTPKPVREFVTEKVFYAPPGYCDLEELHDQSLKESLQDINFKANGFKLNAWYLDAQDPKKPTVVISHGRNNCIKDMEPLMLSLRKEGFGIFAYDYPGFGNSKGRPSEASLYHSGLAASNYIKKFYKIPLENQVLLGHSLGGAVAVDIASKLAEPPRALVVVNSFTTIKEAFNSLATEKKNEFYKDLLDANKIELTFDSKAKMKTITHTPVMVLHADQDRVIDPALGQALHQTAAEVSQLPPTHNQFKLLEGARHRLSPEMCDEIAQSLTQFLKKL